MWGRVPTIKMAKLDVSDRSSRLKLKWLTANCSEGDACRKQNLSKA